MWQTGPAHPQPTRDQVQVWRAPLDLSADDLGLAWARLTDDERQRARRFRLERDQHRFVAARGILRTILGRCLGYPPRELQFRPGWHGKPALVVPDGTGVQFNIAHSDDLLLCAMSVGRALGVDLERIQPDLEIESLLRRFAHQEIEALLELPAKARREAFFACWTAKEAYLKARGEGLANPLSSFAVTVRPDEPPGLLAADDPDELSRWSFHRLEPGDGYAAALAVEGHDWNLRRWDWAGWLAQG